MKSENLSSRKGSVFGLSGMWMNMMLKRDMIIMFVALAAYFLACIFPVILYFHDFRTVSSYMSDLITSGFTLVPFISAIYSIVVSVMLFDYLHSGASCAGAHSFPLTRGKLYRSSLATGTILLLAPLALIAAGMFVLGLVAPASRDADPAVILSGAACAKWFIDNALGSLFMFAIANLAGILAGRNVIHVLLAYLLNGIIGTVCILIDSYAESFIIGAKGAGLADKALYSNPFTWYMGVRQGALSVKDIPMMLAFFAAAVVITVITGILYKKIKLEREQNATVFPLVSDFLVILCSFCNMSAFGLLIATLAGNGATVLPLKVFLVASLISGVASFAVFRMIADSSVRIFHPRALVNFLAFALVTCVIFAFTCFDITGQADKVPVASEVSKVTVNTGGGFSTEIELTEPESIEKAISLHKTLLSDKEKLSGEGGDRVLDLYIEYEMKDGSGLERVYRIDDIGKFREAAEKADDLMRCDEYMEKCQKIVDRIAFSNTAALSINTDTASVAVEPEDKMPLLTAYMKDRKENTVTYYQNLYFNDNYDENLGFDEQQEGVISCDSEFDINPENDNDYDNLSLFFGKKDRHVLKFLKEKGYIEKIAKLEKNPEG